MSARIRGFNVKFQLLLQTFVLGGAMSPFPRPHLTPLNSDIPALLPLLLLSLRSSGRVLVHSAHCWFYTLSTSITLRLFQSRLEIIPALSSRPPLPMNADRPVCMGLLRYCIRASHIRAFLLLYSIK